MEHIWERSLGVSNITNQCMDNWGYNGVLRLSEILLYIWVRTRNRIFAKRGQFGKFIKNMEPVISFEP
jgi:hypothetical protein